MRPILFIFALLAYSLHAQEISISTSVGVEQEYGIAEKEYSFYLSTPESVYTLTGDGWEDYVFGTSYFHKYFAYNYKLPSIDINYKLKNNYKFTTRYQVQMSRPFLVNNTFDPTFIEKVFSGGRTRYENYDTVKRSAYVYPLVTHNLTLKFQVPVVSKKNFDLGIDFMINHRFSKVSHLYLAGWGDNYIPRSRDTLTLDFFDRHINNWRGYTSVGAGVEMKFGSLGFYVNGSFGLYSPEKGSDRFFKRFNSIGAGFTYELFQRPVSKVDIEKKEEDLLSLRKQKGRISLLAKYHFMDLSILNGQYLINHNLESPSYYYGQWTVDSDEDFYWLRDTPQALFFPTGGFAYTRSIGKNLMFDAEATFTYFELKYDSIRIKIDSDSPYDPPDIAYSDHTNTFYWYNAGAGVSWSFNFEKFGQLLLSSKAYVEFVDASYREEHVLKYFTFNYSAAIGLEYNYNGWGLGFQFKHLLKNMMRFYEVDYYPRHLICYLRIPFIKL